jgi:cell fate regulator YaaT (PSP1 superfamily)
MQQQVEVRFRISPKTYSFINFDSPLKKGDSVIVETSLGQSFGIVESVSEEIVSEKTLKKVIRKATDEDIKKNEENRSKEAFAVQKTKELVDLYKLDMNVVNAEYSFDGTKLLIDFVSEDRVDFRDLVKDLASVLHSRIELHQIGPRDQAKMVGGIGVCGRVCCCASHLKDFGKVSIKMAKVQNLSLNPTKISGSCGRLMCCLAYENPYYSEVYAKMPKINAEVKTPDGIGCVVYQDMLSQTLSVKLTLKDGATQIKDYPLDSISKVEKKEEKLPSKEENSSKKSKKQ